MKKELNIDLGKLIDGQMHKEIDMIFDRLVQTNKHH